MKFREDKNARGFYKVKNGGFLFTISSSKNGFYVIAIGQKKDIRLNTLWLDKEFNTFEEAEIFCENFDWKKYNCIGDDVNCG